MDYKKFPLITPKQVTLNTINTVNVLTNLQDYFNTFGSSTGVNLEGVVTNADGSITISNGAGWLRVGDDVTSDLLPVQIPEVTLMPPNNTRCYIAANYNGGNPRFEIVLDVTTIQCRSICVSAVVYRMDLDTKVLPYGNVAADHGALAARKSALQSWIEHGSDALIGFSTLDINVSAGIFYNGINLYSTPAFDTSTGSTFNLWYRDGAGGWTYLADQTTIVPNYYDDGSGTLNTSVAKYRVYFVYLMIDSPTTLEVVAGQKVYPSVSDAEKASLPSTVPPWAEKYGLGVLVGTVIVKASESTITEVGSAFLSTLTFTAPTSHDGLADVFLAADGVTYGHISDAPQSIYGLKSMQDDFWVLGDVSAGSFTDRTPYPNSLKVALDAVNSMQRLPVGVYEPDNKDKQLDHSKLHPYLNGSGENPTRDMSSSISCINEATKYLLKQNKFMKVVILSLVLMQIFQIYCR